MVLRYIEGNPVRARIVESVVQRQWSYHNEVVRADKRGLIETVPVKLPEDWTGYVDHSLEDNELDVIRRRVNRQTPLGDTGWLARICKKFGLEPTVKRRGRPRKDTDA